MQTLITGRGPEVPAKRDELIEGHFADPFFTDFFAAGFFGLPESFFGLGVSSGNSQ
jgi:hypothetical protein